MASINNTKFNSILGVGMVPGLQPALKRLADLDELCIKLAWVVPPVDRDKVVDALSRNLVEYGEIFAAVKVTYDWYIRDGSSG